MIVRGDDPAEVNAAAQVDDPESVYAFYQRLVALRHTDQVVVYGDFRMLLPDDPAVYAFARALDGHRLQASVGQAHRVLAQRALVVGHGLELEPTP